MILIDVFNYKFPTRYTFYIFRFKLYEGLILQKYIVILLNIPNITF